MLMLPREIHDLRHLCFGDLIGIETAYPHSVLMDMEHDDSCLFPPLVEEPLQHMDDKLHRSVVVVEEKNLVERGLLRFGLRLRDDAGTNAPVLITAPPVVRHSVPVTLCEPPVRSDAPHSY